MYACHGIFVAESEGLGMIEAKVEQLGSQLASTSSDMHLHTVVHMLYRSYYINSCTLVTWTFQDCDYLQLVESKYLDQQHIRTIAALEWKSYSAKNSIGMHASFHVWFKVTHHLLQCVCVHASITLACMHVPALTCCDRIGYLSCEIDPLWALPVTHACMTSENWAGLFCLAIPLRNAL